MTQPAPRNTPNPFYVAVAVIGAAFAATVGAFFLAATWDAIPPEGRVGVAGSGASFWPRIVSVLDRHGPLILGVQVGLLAIASFAAMASDRRALSTEKARDAAASDRPAPPSG